MNARLLRTAAGIGIGVTAGRWLFQRHAAVADAAPRLRSPLLYLPLSLTNERVLKIVRETRRRATHPVPGTRITHRQIDGCDVVLYDRADRARPSGALLWIHGGGRVQGTPNGDHQLCSLFARELGILVVSADYRLAPENPYPAGLDDCMTAFSWLAGATAEYGIDHSRIAVGGSDAGGGLAAEVAQRAHDEIGPRPAFQLLASPMLDDRTPGGDDGGRDKLVWTAASNRFCWNAYLGHAADTDDQRPYVAAARRQDLTGLPAAWIGVGDLDLFRTESTRYADRLLRAGVDCALEVVPRMYHGADVIAPSAPETASFRQSMINALRPVIGPN